MAKTQKHSAKTRELTIMAQANAKTPGVTDKLFYTHFNYPPFVTLPEVQCLGWYTHIIIPD
jgi:hypothetical protein